MVGVLGQMTNEIMTVIFGDISISPNINYRLCHFDEILYNIYMTLGPYHL